MKTQNTPSHCSLPAAPYRHGGAWFNETLDVTLGGETRIFLSYNFWTFHLPGEMCKGIFRETVQSIYIYKVVTWDKMHFLSITHFFKKNTLFTFWINNFFFLFPFFWCVKTTCLCTNIEMAITLFRDL